MMDNSNTSGNFLLFVGQDQMGENYLTHSHIWGPKNTLGETFALHIQNSQAPPNKSCMGERQSIAQKGACAIDARNSQL